MVFVMKSTTTSSLEASSNPTPPALMTLRALLGLSRAPISVFVVIHAGLAAVLALQGLPSWPVIIIGTLSCLTGALSLIGLNDLVDVEIDRARLKHLRTFKSFDMGSTFSRHPIAQGLISFRLGAVWIVGLAIISMFLAYLLKPWLPLLFLSIAFFVTVYSYLATVSLLRYPAVAMAVMLGALAGWLAVSDPDTVVFPLFALWSFFYEVGGRNIPNDFGDADEDAALNLKTLPVVYGHQKSSSIAFFFIVMTILTSIVMIAAAQLPTTILVATFVWGLVFLAIPGYRLLRTPKPRVAVKLFNAACFYPPAILFTLAVFLLFF